jgi:transposase-like protein
MQRLSRVRKHLTSVQREKILERYLGSSLTQKQFAAQVGIGVSTLHAWLRQASGGRNGGGSGFLPAPNLFSGARPAPAYRVEWPGGLSLEVRAGFAGKELAALLAVLPGV